MVWSDPHVGGGSASPNPILNCDSNTPAGAIKSLDTASVETGPKLREHSNGQTLYKYVHELGGHRNVQDAHITDGYAFSYKVEVNLDMLGAG
jgi:hypothetical protein